MNPSVTTAIKTHSRLLPLFGDLAPEELAPVPAQPFDPSVDNIIAGQPPSIGPRQDIIERTYKSAEPEFIQMYRAFLLAYAERHEDFIAGEVTAAFGEIHRPVSETEGKQLGHLYQLLQRDGSIEKTGGYRARNQGNASAVYRLQR